MLGRPDMDEVWRRAAYRRALERVGMLPQSIEVTMRKDDLWLRQGADIKAAKRRRRKP